jgi:hypothetical protein
MGVIRSLLAFVFFVLGAAIVAVTLAIYLAVTGRSLPMLRALAAGVDRALAGQQTSAVSLEVYVQPAARRLSGTAHLTVHAPGGDRARLYFLLNDGLHVRAVRDDAATAHDPLPFLRFGPLLVIELPRSLSADEEVRIAVEYLGRPRRGLSPGMRLESDSVVLTPADLWYPNDLQSFFDASVDVLLPAGLSVVHNGREASDTSEGAAHRVRFTLDRPVPGLALVAGRYTAAAPADGAVRVWLGPDVHLDPQRIRDEIAAAAQIFTTRYGPSGFGQTSVFVDARLSRAFNDGSGLIGVPLRDFADAAYGFPLLAHEVAHEWWGATVAEHWLQPNTGGEWIVEGFAELSSWRAVREQLGERALLQTLARAAFDPDRTVALIAPTVLDNALDPEARTTIYDKGGYVAYMLEQALGDDAFDAAARQFLEQFRYRSATAADLEATFATAAHRDLAAFFNAWVRGNEAIDLALEPQPDGGAAVRNHRTAPAPEQIALWRFPHGAEPERGSTTVGATLPIGNAERVVLDPLGSVADMFRSNNVLPRTDPPRFVATSVRGDTMVVSGEPCAWESATIDVRARSGKPQSWVIDRGLLGEPTWSADGTRILAVESPRAGQPTLLALSLTDGSRRTIGHDAVAAGAADSTIVARRSRLLRLSGWRTSVLVEHPDGDITSPLAAADGSVAYAVLWPTGTMDLRVLPAAGGSSRVLFTWPSMATVRWQWSPDASRLFAVLRGEWDWQLWELPLDDSPARALVREAARIADLAVAADGAHVAIVAQPDLDDPQARAEVIVIDRAGAAAQRFDLSGRTASSVAWMDEGTLLVVVADPSDPSLPVATELVTLRLADGSVEPLR